MSRKKWQATEMVKYKCSVCGCVYDPELGDPDSGISQGTLFEKLPNGWMCPVCLNLGVKVFRLIE